jgi:methionyl-tRNA formyltransferase
MALRIVFAGTPEFAVPALRVCAERGETVAVYTQPDRPSGRGRQLQPSPVKQAALDRGIPVFQPEHFKSEEALAVLRSHRADVMVVVAYGLILPPAVLATPRLGCWNVHASLLPRWRGAAPIQRAIEAGDKRTGVCLMQMEKGLDTGPVLLQLPAVIGPRDTGGSLHDRLSGLGAEVLSDGLKLARLGMQLQPDPQPSEGVTYARKLEKSEAQIDWNRPARTLADQVRAFNPWPVAECRLQDERVRIHQALALPDNAGQPPGQILAAGRQGIDIACAEGALRLLALQRDGGRVLTAAEYLNARPLTF